MISVVSRILLFDKAGELVGAVKDGKILVDEKGRKIREITNQRIKISDLIKELVQRKLSSYVA